MMKYVLIKVRSTIGRVVKQMRSGFIMSIGFYRIWPHCRQSPGFYLFFSLMYVSSFSNQRTQSAQSRCPIFKFFYESLTRFSVQYNKINLVRNQLFLERIQLVKENIANSKPNLRNLMYYVKKLPSMTCPLSVSLNMNKRSFCHLFNAMFCVILAASKQYNMGERK